MSKINIIICTGTTCYVMGAGELLGLGQHIGEELAEHVEIVGSNCLELCKDEQYGSAPYVKVNETVICEATLTKVAEEIKRQQKLALK